MLERVHNGQQIGLGGDLAIIFARHKAVQFHGGGGDDDDDDNHEGDHAVEVWDFRPGGTAGLKKKKNFQAPHSEVRMGLVRQQPPAFASSWEEIYDTHTSARCEFS